MQKTTAKHYVKEKEYKLEVLTGTLPMENKKLHRRCLEKVARGRGDGGH